MSFNKLLSLFGDSVPRISFVPIATGARHFSAVFAIDPIVLGRISGLTLIREAPGLVPLCLSLSRERLEKLANRRQSAFAQNSLAVIHQAMKNSDRSRGQH